MVNVLDPLIPLTAYTSIDLSVQNTALSAYKLSDPGECQAYIDTVLKQNEAKVAYGGYLEQRNLYRDNPNFSSTTAARNIHLGIDFWAETGTKVICPAHAKVHSFKNNAIAGDYGPTIILSHHEGAATYYSLYGHLSVASLQGLYVGKIIEKGTAFAALGSPVENVNYAPHLHFQIIKDMADYQGDYPGVCNQLDQRFYEENCPNPLLFFTR